MTRLFWLSDDAWAAIEPHLPQGKPGKPRVDDRRVISGILHVLKTGCRWRDCPSKYGPHTTIYNRYNRWSKRRIWQRIFEKMAAAGPVPEELCIDTSHVKAHRSAAGSKRGSTRKRLGWPRDGRAGTTPPKLTTNALITLDAHGVAHAAADAQRSETFFGVAHFGRAHQHNRSALNALANGQWR
jgi:transposase